MRMRSSITPRTSPPAVLVALLATLVLLAAACGDRPGTAADEPAVATDVATAPADEPGEPVHTGDEEEPLGEEPEERYELTVATGDVNINPVTNSALGLADELGYYEREGVDVTFLGLEGTPAAVAALNSGDTDLAHIGVENAIELVSRGLIDIRAIGSASLGPPFLIATRDDITSVADLEGRTFAINRAGSLDHSLTEAVLRGLDFDPGTMSYVAVGSPPLRVQALVQGRVDATTVSGGAFLAARGEPGVHVLVPMDEFFLAAPVQGTFIVGTTEFLDNNAEAVRRFLRGLINMSRTFLEDPDLWVEDMELVRPDLERVDLLDTVPYLTDGWCVNGCLDHSLLEFTFDYLYDHALSDLPRIPVEDVIDDRYLLDVLDDLGTYSDPALIDSR